MGNCSGTYVERGMHKGLKEGGEKNVDTVTLAAEVGEKIEKGIESGITNASQPLSHEISKSLKEGGNNIGKGIELAGGELKRGK